MALRPLDPAIVNAYQAPKFNMPDPLQDVAALEQIKSGRVNRQIHEQQLAQLQQDRLALDEMQKRIEAAGGPSNLKSAFTEMINSKLPKYAEIGYAGLQKIKEQEDFQSLINPKALEAPPGPAVSTAPVPGQAISMMPVNAPRNALATPQTDNANQLAAMAAPQAQPSLPTNMLASDADQIDRQIQGAYALGTPRALAYAKALEARRDEANKNIVVSPGATVFQGGKVVYTAPEKAQGQPSLVQEYNFAKTQDGGGFKGSYQDFVVARSAAMRPPVQPPAPSPLERVFDTKTGSQELVDRSEIRANPGRYKPLGAEEKLRPIPETINKALTGNVSSLSQIDKAIDAATNNPNAIGLKGNMPQAILNRTDPQGVETRALITDIGSAIVHDRSGAAVAASERPGLVPFIPQATDDAATAIKKLKQLKAKVEADQNGILDFYSQEQGYKPSLYHKQQNAPAETSAPAAAKPAAADIGSLPPKVTKNGKTYVLQPNGKYIEQ